MTYIDPRTGQRVDVAHEPLPRLIGLLMLIKGPKGVYWVKANGEAAVALLVRAVRARYYRDRVRMSGKVRALLNDLDPPRCRCGQPGTHIIGGTTFCAGCGPTAKGADNAAARRRGLDIKSRDRNEKQTSYEQHEQANRQMKSVWKGR